MTETPLRVSPARKSGNKAMLPSASLTPCACSDNTCNSFCTSSGDDLGPVLCALAGFPGSRSGKSSNSCSERNATDGSWSLHRNTGGDEPMCSADEQSELDDGDKNEMNDLVNFVVMESSLCENRRSEVEQSIHRRVCRTGQY